MDILSLGSVAENQNLEIEEIPAYFRHQAAFAAREKNPPRVWSGYFFICTCSKKYGFRQNF
jgi:hypothetical protein